MKIWFWSVGKKHESYVQEGVEMFTKRISHYYPIDWFIIPSPKNSASLSELDLRKKEGETLLGFLQQDDHLVLLDEKGKLFHTEELALFLNRKSDENIRNLIFFIGGAYGVSDAVKQRADLQWSLSPLVFPHQLVRLVLAEQIYRACTITRNEKYHHS